MPDQTTTLRRSAGFKQVDGVGRELDEFLIDDFTAAMANDRHNTPRGVELVVPSHLIHEGYWAAVANGDVESPSESWPADSRDIAIQIRVTCVRKIWPGVNGEPGEWTDYPEFEVDGHLVDPPSHLDEGWVRLTLGTTGDRRLTEGTIFLLEPGEELGYNRTPGMK
jgi:hypothetical protein